MIDLEAKNIHFCYDKTTIIENVSLSLNQAEFLGIIGPNGAGKSTMLRLLCGILKPKTGSIRLFGSELLNQSQKKIAQKIAFVPQETHFALDFTVEEIVGMGRYPYQRPFQREDPKDHAAIESALTAANVGTLRRRLVNTLSSGERQRVVIARALAQIPRILLLDEPTSHLDLHHQHVIMGLLKKLNAEGISIAVVHHDLNLASLYCERLILVHQGKIFAEGTPKDLLNQETLAEVYGTAVRIVRHPEKDVPQIFLRTDVNHEDNH
jgi:iron complex transport system ATP-binding protein